MRGAGASLPWAGDTDPDWDLANFLPSRTGTPEWEEEVASALDCMMVNGTPICPVWFWWRLNRMVVAVPAVHQGRPYIIIGAVGSRTVLVGYEP